MRLRYFSIVLVVASCLGLLAAAPATQPKGLGLSHYHPIASFEKDVARFESQSTTQPAPENCTVFIGSSSFTLWKSLEKDMARFHAVNRGFGGSRTDDLLFYGRRILHPLKPRWIAYFCGSNDLAAGRSVETVIENFKSFVKLAREESPGVEVIFVSLNICPKRVQYSDGFRQVNKQAAQWAATQKDVKYIDATTGLMDETGEPKLELFRPDGIHLNEEGYRIWKGNIEKGLSAIEKNDG